MANINIEEYIKEMDLSPELAEKARQCKTSSELMELAAENDVELPMDALAGVAGGCSGGQLYCHICGSYNIGQRDVGFGNVEYYCKHCGAIV